MNPAEKTGAAKVASGDRAVKGSGYVAAAAKLQALAEKNRQKWAHVADSLSSKFTATQSSTPVPYDEEPAQADLFTRNIQAIVSRSETRMLGRTGGNNALDRRLRFGVNRDIHMQKNAIKSIINFEIIF